MLGLKRLFGPFVKNGVFLDPNLEKIFFDHKEDTLGIILSRISGV